MIAASAIEVGLLWFLHVVLIWAITSFNPTLMSMLARLLRGIFTQSFLWGCLILPLRNRCYRCMDFAVLWDAVCKQN